MAEKEGSNEARFVFQKNVEGVFDDASQAKNKQIASDSILLAPFLPGGDTGAIFGQFSRAESLTKPMAGIKTLDPSQGRSTFSLKSCFLTRKANTKIFGHKPYEHHKGGAGI